MSKLVCSLVVVFILIMPLAGGCVRASAGEFTSPDAGTAVPSASLDDPQKLKRFLDALIAERAETHHILGAESKGVAGLAFCATWV